MRAVHNRARVSVEDAMSQAHAPLRWRAAVMQAARQTLAARWRGTLDALELARHEYGTLRACVTLDVRALRKTAQRIHDLEQLRTVLARELAVPLS
jgi:hypothetical protein